MTKLTAELPLIMANRGIQQLGNVTDFLGFRGLGFRALGFRVSGFRGLGFRV